MHPLSQASRQKLVSLLSEIRDTLLRHDLVPQATVASDLISLANLEANDFSDRLGGGEVWGSAGSIADSISLRPSMDEVDSRTEQDSLELTRLLIRLADEMERMGIASDGSRFVGKAFARGLEMRQARRSRGS